MSEFKTEEKGKDKAAKPKQIKLSKKIREKAREILQTTFHVHSIYGVHVYVDEETKTYTFDESPDKICILVFPKKSKKFVDPIFYDVDLRSYKEFKGTGITSASAAKLAWIAVEGYVCPELELEHRCHRHNCINAKHQHPVPKSLNQQLKKCHVESHKLKQRNQKGHFNKAQKAKTHVPATCDHGPDVPQCIHNLIQSTAKDWKHPERMSIYQQLVKSAFHCFDMKLTWL